MLAPTKCKSRFACFYKSWIRRNAPPRMPLRVKIRGTKEYAGVVELVDSLDLGSNARACRFESCHPHHIGTQVLIRYLRSFSICQKRLGIRLFGTFANKIFFIVSKSNTQKSKLSDLNPPLLKRLNHNETFLKRLVSSCQRLVL